MNSVDAVHAGQHIVGHDAILIMSDAHTQLLGDFGCQLTQCVCTSAGLPAMRLQLPGSLVTCLWYAAVLHCLQYAWCTACSMLAVCLEHCLQYTCSMLAAD
jgi:hypothetical protein